MNSFFIELKEGTLILNGNPISIFYENEFINDIKEIALKKIYYNEFTTYYFPLSLEDFIFEFSITFFQEKNIDRSFSLSWVNCDTRSYDYDIDELIIIKDINRLKIFIDGFFGCFFKKIDNHTFEHISSWGRITIGVSLKTPNVGVYFVYT